MELKDVLTIIGIVGSLFWNFINSFMSHHNWAKNSRLTDFKKAREPIDRALQCLRLLKREARELQAYGGSNDSFNEKLGKLNKSAVASFLELSTALEAVDESFQIEGDRWEKEAQNDWDHVLEKLNDCYSKPKEAEALQGFECALDCFIKTLNDKLEVINCKMHRLFIFPSKLRCVSVFFLVLLIITAMFCPTHQFYKHALSAIFY